MLNNWIRALATAGCTALLFVGGQASAATIGAPAPMAGYDTNSGIERFNAVGSVFAFELMDSPGGAFGEFGIYYDRDTRITLFGADDIGAGQAAIVDLFGGAVMDVDSASFDFFAAQAGDFGFYFKKDGDFIYSETGLNAVPRTASIGSYESLRMNDVYLITLEDERSGQTLAIEAVGGIRPSDRDPSNAVPEPNAAMLFGIGALVMGSAVRRRRN